MEFDIWDKSERKEKIVERLQDLRDSNSNSAKGSWNRNDSLIFSHISNAFQQAIDIIHEEAKAYNEVKTNADYIRNMTDEELADRFVEWNCDLCGFKIVSSISYMIKGNLGEYYETREEATRVLLDWLKAEREG